jgi:hypothetical protein
MRIVDLERLRTLCVYKYSSVHFAGVLMERPEYSNLENA